MFTSPSGKRYIGQTVEELVETRWKKHPLKSSNCTLLKRAIAKYGWENIKKEVLLVTNNILLNYYEKLFIKLYNSLAPNGYNCNPGGDNHSWCEDTKIKLSDSLRNYWEGRRRGSISVNSAGNYSVKVSTFTERGTRSELYLGTYKSREWADKTVKQWYDDGTISQQGRVKPRPRGIGNVGIIQNNGNGFHTRDIINGKKVNIGTYKTREQANKAVHQFRRDGTILQEGLIKIIKTRPNGNIEETPSGRFKARKNHKSLGTFPTRQEAQKAIDDYVLSM
tara:strand:+ start:1137 stop:1973 length:837 start_codon:yes stop_codon:yes gene_type:complete